ncbi:MAG: dienelactone hydrolase family protein [Roseococcus sp.]
MQPLVALEAPAEPVEETEAFTAAGATGTLVLPQGAPDRRTPAIVILQDGEEPDGRASLYIDQLLGAGFAVLEMVQVPGDSLDAVLAGLARHPRVAGQPLGLLGFGAGARLAAAMPEPVAARALLYPGCEGIAPAAMPAQPVLLMHGAADPANPAASCENLARALGQVGAAVRLRVLARASYAWDRPGFAGEGHAMLPRPDGAGRVRAEAWPELAAFSAAEVVGFFAASLLGQRP